MTPNEIYARPPIKVASHIWEFESSFPEVDFHQIAASACEGLEMRLYANHCEDGERIWKMGVVALDGTPFMIVQEGGRGGRDHNASFISHPETYKAAVERLRALYDPPEGGDEERVCGPDTDKAELTEFYNGRLEDFYDPTLVPKHKAGDVLMVNVPENHIDWMNTARITTRVRVDFVYPMNPRRTYHGLQLDRAPSTGGNRLTFVATEPGKGALGASFNDKDVVSVVSQA